MDPIPAVERDIALDLVRRSVFVAPIVLAVGALVAGVNGVISVAIALGVVAANFLVSAFSVGWAAKVSPQAVGGAAVVSYVLRLAAIFVALFLLKDQSWIDLKVLGFSIVGTHLALLLWETKHVSISLAAPGLKPGGHALSREER
ncbi:MAG: hypothetical protein JWL83_1127 [Actinomycetia bacterium]|nr:hypothetical protein [Actinomycetes bacterium]